MKILITYIALINSLWSFGQWELISPNVDEAVHTMWDLEFINKDTGFVVGRVGDYNQILRTFNGGISWDSTSTADLGLPLWNTFHDINFVNDTLGYIACRGNVLKTIDCGNSWISLDTADVWGSSQMWYNIQFINKDTGFIAYQDGGAQFLRTFDGGWTWEDDPVMSGIRNFTYHDGVFMGCWGGWAMLDVPSMTWEYGYGVLEYVSGLNFDNALYHNGSIIVLGDRIFPSYALYATSDDMGETWRLRYFDVWQIDGVQFLDNNLGYAIGQLQGSLKTWDGGETWYLMEVNDMGYGLDKSMEEFQMINDTLGYAISSSSIYKTVNGGGTQIMQIPSIDVTSIGENPVKEFKIYPNPVNDIINLSSIDVSLERLLILDINGKLVADIQNISTSIDVSDLSSGQYVIRAYSDNSVYSSRFVKQ